MNDLLSNVCPLARQAPRAGFCIKQDLLILFLGLVAVCFAGDARAAHEGHDGKLEVERHDPSGSGYEISGLSFRVFVDRGTEGAVGGSLDEAGANSALRTVIETFAYLNQRRHNYPRFDEAVSRGLLDRVIIQPSVRNHEGRSFPFLVVRTVEPGRVRLLVSASSMKEGGFLGAAEQFAPVVAREFQWVVSKADTAQKPKSAFIERDLPHAPIGTDQNIKILSGEERVRLLQRLFETYLRTVDDLRSLEGQPYYEIGSTALVAPSQPDSTTRFYDIRIREALQKIVRDPLFLDRTPLAVTSLLNGTIWNVAFVKIDQRDWATRTRVLPADKAVKVGESGRVIQPAAVLVNLHRAAAPDDLYYADTKQLPMGALSTDQLALVIAKEIQQNIVEKSQTGHVAQDALTAPQ
ncbi:MAG: hypothetical protein NDI90_21390 [Nitrospira sp. BO4]|nr:hypothetical protein [Nitrospira sp. BO4]